MNKRTKLVDTIGLRKNQNSLFVLCEKNVKQNITDVISITRRHV